MKDGTSATCPVRSIPARSFEDVIVGYIGELGRHPEIIESTVAASNRAKLSSLRPLKAKLAALEKECKNLAEQIQSCVETVKKKGAENISQAFIAEADALAARKRDLDIERERLRIDVEYRERVVADEKFIADSLLQFESIMEAVPPEEQKELVQTLVKQITVNHLDPKRDEVPAKEGVFKTKIRTSWYVVNVELFATDLLAKVWKKGQVSSDFSQIGSAGSAQIRTSLSIEVIVAIPFARWGAQPYVTHPFPYPETLAAAAHASGSECTTQPICCAHPIHLALKWREMLDANDSLTMSQLARIQSVSRARVTQIMNLLALPQDVQAHLIALQEPAAIRYFSEHKLRSIAADATSEMQVRRFGELCQSFGSATPA